MRRVHRRAMEPAGAAPELLQGPAAPRVLMARLRPLILILCLLAVAGCVHERAQARRDALNFAVLEDPSGALNIDQAASRRLSSRYRLNKGPSISLGFSRSALWVRIPMSQAPPGDGPWRLEVRAPWLDRVDLYTPLPGGGRRRQSTGLQQPEREALQRSYLLTVPAGIPRDGYLYLRMESKLALNASLRLWPEKEFNDHSVSDSYLYGFLYGIMATMIIINLVVFSAARRRAYLLYVLYLASMILHQTCLQGQILFMPTWLWPWVPHLSLAATASVFFFGSAFCRAFLQTRENVPWANRLLIGIQVAAALLLALTLAGRIWWGTWLAHAVAMVGPLVCIAAGVTAWVRGFRPARFYLAAWLILLMGSIAWGAWTIGWLNGAQVPQTSIIAAAALESALLTLALADWVRTMERDRALLAKRERRYHQLSITDELSGLHNARYFWSRLSSEVDHAHGLDLPLSLVFLDIDDFKEFNDAHGHPEGDKVLSQVGRVLRQCVRPMDTPCRYGGEEFALILPGAKVAAAREVGERVRRAMAELVFQPGRNLAASVTVSLGVAQLQSDQDAQTLVERADAALYAAKRRGKDCLVIAGGK